MLGAGYCKKCWAERAAKNKTVKAAIKLEIAANREKREASKAKKRADKAARKLLRQQNRRPSVFTSLSLDAVLCHYGKLTLLDLLPSDILSPDVALMLKEEA